MKKSGWHDTEKEALRLLWKHDLTLSQAARILSKTTGSTAGNAMRMHLHFGRKVRTIGPGFHRAAIESRTAYPGTVREPDAIAVLKPGFHQRKLGNKVEKGPFKGMPIYSLTLEERATCPTSCLLWRNCVTPETPVLTIDLRWVPIGTLSVGDEIAAFSEKANAYGHRITQTATVERLGRAVEPCFRVVTTRGVVIATAKHLWLRRRSDCNYLWWATDKLKAGDKLQFFQEPWETDLSYDAGRLRGFVEGEGTCGTTGRGGYCKSRLSWAQRPGGLCDEIIGLAQGLGFRTARYERIAGVAHTDISHIDVVGGWKEVARFLGRIRPTRMIEKAKEIWERHAIGGRGGVYATVLAVEPVGDREVVTIQTSTRTMVAGGFFTHNCYGNGMGVARRWRHGPELEAKLWTEMKMLNRKHRRTGFLVRLHILGDFYSTEYVEFWKEALEAFPRLHVFGYSARQLSDPIGKLVIALRNRNWKRFAVRTSGAEDGPRTLVLRDVQKRPPAAIICPAQTGKTECCGTCGLCWAPAAKDRPIAFLEH